MSRTLFKKSPQRYEEAVDRGTHSSFYWDDELTRCADINPAPFGLLPEGFRVLVPRRGYDLYDLREVWSWLRAHKEGEHTLSDEQIEDYSGWIQLEERIIKRGFTDGVVWRTHWQGYRPDGSEYRVRALESLSMLTAEIAEGLCQPQVSTSLMSPNHPMDLHGWTGEIKMSGGYETIDGAGGTDTINANCVLAYQSVGTNNKWVPCARGIYHLGWTEMLREMGCDIQYGSSKKSPPFDWEAADKMKPLLSSHIQIFQSGKGQEIIGGANV
jgi:hypothetical protein